MSRIPDSFQRTRRCQGLHPLRRFPEENPRPPDTGLQLESGETKSVSEATTPSLEPTRRLVVLVRKVSAQTKGSTSAPYTVTPKETNEVLLLFLPTFVWFFPSVRPQDFSPSSCLYNTSNVDGSETVNPQSSVPELTRRTLSNSTPFLFPQEYRSVVYLQVVDKRDTDL